MSRIFSSFSPPWRLGGLILALTALTLPLPVSAQRASTGRSAALIVARGTGTGGYRIYVTSDGQAGYVTTSRRGRATGQRHQAALPAPLARQFFADLARAAPVNHLAITPLLRHRVQGGPFGMQFFVTYRGRHSPNLRLVNRGRGMAVYRDVRRIAQALKLLAPPSR